MEQIAESIDIVPREFQIGLFQQLALCGSSKYDQQAFDFAAFIFRTPSRFPHGYSIRDNLSLWDFPENTRRSQNSHVRKENVTRGQKKTLKAPTNPQPVRLSIYRPRFTPPQVMPSLTILSRGKYMYSLTTGEKHGILEVEYRPVRSEGGEVREREDPRA